MTDEDRIARIRATAAEHNGFYLLPHRYGGVSSILPKTETDLDYDACAALVNRREARWLRADVKGPGIEIVRAPRPEPPPRPAMSLDEALRRLCDVHTRDDDMTGFHVVVGAVPDAWQMEQGEYTRCWEAVRRHLGLQDEPQR
jgi:hypothetical protein